MNALAAPKTIDASLYS